MAKICPGPGDFSEQSTAPFQTVDLLHMETHTDVEEPHVWGHEKGCEGKFREDKHLQVPGTVVCHYNKCPGR